MKTLTTCTIVVIMNPESGSRKKGKSYCNIIFGQKKLVRLISFICSPL